jgi:hypothetical protein
MRARAVDATREALLGLSEKPQNTPTPTPSEALYS